MARWVDTLSFHYVLVPVTAICLTINRSCALVPTSAPPEANCCHRLSASQARACPARYVNMRGGRQGILYEWGHLLLLYYLRCLLHEARSRRR